MKGAEKSMRTMLIALVLSVIAFAPALPASAQEIPCTLLMERFSRFPFAQVISLDEKGGCGIIYADVYGKLHIIRSTEKGWKLEWELTNLGSKIRKFFVRDLEGDGTREIIIATRDGRILVYSMGTYQNVWENLEDNFTVIQVIEVANVDDDSQLEFVFIADGRMHIVDGVSKSKQVVSQRTFDATEIIVANIDKDPQVEVVLNSGLILDSRFYNVDVAWDKPFGDRITLFDMNNDGMPEIIGEFSDYSLRIFDAYARREVW
jgi:hypothetical protein